MSWDYYLYLTVGAGAEKIVKIHDQLYSGLLSSYWEKSLSYIPHITLGFFANQ